MIFNEIDQAVRELRNTAARLNATADGLAELLLRSGEWPTGVEAPKAAVFQPVPEFDEDDNPFEFPVTTTVSVSTEISGSKNLPEAAEKNTESEPHPEAAAEEEPTANEPTAADEPEAPEDSLTLEAVRAVLCEANHAGHGAEIRELFEKLGCKKLTEIPAEHYPMLMAAANRMLGITEKIYFERNF